MLNRPDWMKLLRTLACAVALPCFAVDADDPFSYWPSDLKIGGTVIACASGEIDPEIPKIFREAAGGDEAKIVVIDLRAEPDRDGALANLLLGDAAPSATILDSVANDLAVSQASLSTATGILILSATPVASGDGAWLSAIAPDLNARVRAGAVVCAVGPSSALLGSRVLGTQAAATSGLALIPDAIIGSGDGEDREGMLATLRQHPLCVGISIPDDCAIVLEGRKIRIFGERPTTFLLAGTARQPERSESISAGAGRRSNPYETIADLTAWRRDAIERQLPAFPSDEPPVPNVPNGHLIIVGGGGMPRGLMARMVEMAGGNEAKMIYVPCTEAEEVDPDSGPIREWKEMGVASALVFHTKDRHQANSDEAFLAPLKEATGIWFGGGRQWNLADSYFGTRAHALMRAVLARGGVIGGSSAGASIQADYLARANPVANFDIMAAGYERGLGFIEGVAIDQHFSQRGRQKDMSQLADRYPQLLGIGIDEATALIVSGSQAEIAGRGKVYFYDRRRETAAGEPDYQAYAKGTIFDLAERKPHSPQAVPPQLQSPQPKSQSPPPESQSPPPGL